MTCFWPLFAEERQDEEKQERKINERRPWYIPNQFGTFLPTGICTLKEKTKKNQNPPGNTAHIIIIPLAMAASLAVPAS